MDDIFTGSGATLSQTGLDNADAKLTLCRGQRALIWTVLAVETRGFGWLNDKRPKILFERHIFHNRTQGQFSAAHPDISNPQRGGYLGGASEYRRLKAAMLLDRRAALESASWGLGQIMGFNAVELGYADVDDMVRQFKEGEDKQLEASARFISRNAPLHEALVRGNWQRFAFYYNGKNYAANGYDVKLRQAYDRFSARVPDLDVRNEQAWLLYAGFDPKGVDGDPGSNTMQALEAFQTTYNANGGKPKLRTDGTFDQFTQDALKKAAEIS